MRKLQPMAAKGISREIPWKARTLPIRAAKAKRAAAALLALCMALLTFGALADGKTLVPVPPDVPVYWQLARVEQSPEEAPAGGYAIWGEGIGMQPDLSDPLLTASQLGAEGAVQGVKLVLERNDQVVMEHEYIWTPMPVFIVPGEAYTVEVSGLKTAGGQTPNSLLGIYRQGVQVARISAGEYSGHAHSTAFTVSAEEGIYSDGSLVFSFVLRDVNDMYRDRIAYVYEMHGGVKPEPTAVPGYVPVALAEDVAIPSYYVAVPDMEALFTIVTAPDQYRAYGSMSGSAPAFFPADAAGKVLMSEAPADPQTDFDQYVRGFVPAEPVGGLPPYLRRVGEGMYSFTTRDGELMQRAFGRIDGGDPMLYPVVGGVVPQGAEPVNLDDDFEQYVRGFGPATPPSVPAHYEVLEGGVYAFTGRDAVTRYRVYGRIDGQDAAFHESDVRGEPIEGAEPVSPEGDFEQYIRGFDAEVPDASVVPAYYRRIADGLYAIDDREGNPVYRVYGVMDGRSAAFYPATATGEPERTDAEPLAPEGDFEAYVKGFTPSEPAEVPSFYEATEVPGVWGFVDRDDLLQYRVHGSLNRGEAAFYPANAFGEVREDALPVNPASDLALLPPPPFVAQAPQTLPPHYQVIDQARGIYGYQDGAGETRYAVFGTRGAGAPSFYASDDKGEIAYDAVPIDTEAEYAQLFGSFTPAAAPEAPARYVAVPDVEGLYQYQDSDNNTVSRVYGAFTADEDLQFYPADGAGRVTSRLAADPAEDLQTMPLLLENTVSTKPPAAASQATPVIRAQAVGQTRWSDPNAPLPTEYIASILPRETATGASQALARMITAAPALAIEPLPTDYGKTVQGPGDGTEPAPDAVRTLLEAATLAPPEDAPILSAVQSPVAVQGTQLPGVTASMDAALDPGREEETAGATGPGSTVVQTPAAIETDTTDEGRAALASPSAAADAGTSVPTATELGAATASDAPAAEAATAGADASPGAARADDSAPPPNQTARWVVLAAVAVAVIGGVIYYFVKRGKDTAGRS